MRTNKVATGRAVEAPIPPSTTVKEANTRLRNFAHVRNQDLKQRDRDAAQAKRDAAEGKLPTLPPLPKAARKAKPAQVCACGCGGMTRGGRWVPGHDARITAWALRVQRGLIKASEVPAPHTDAVKQLLKLRKDGIASEKNTVGMGGPRKH